MGQTIVRLIAGIVFFVIAAFGVLIGVVYPWAAANEQGYELGRWQAVSASGEGFASFETILPSNEERVVVRVEIETPLDLGQFDRDVILTLTASRAGRTEIAEAFIPAGISPKETREPSAGRRYVLEAGTLYPVDDEPFSFVFTEGEVAIPLTSVELVLVGGTFDYDEGVPPIGYGLMGIGLVGFALSIRKRREKPSPPRWGRG